MKSVLFALLCLSALCLQNPLVFGQGTTFTYQGQLRVDGAPAHEIFDFRLALYDLTSGSTLVAGPITNSAVAVEDGLFTLPLDFGSDAFEGSPRWLEIGVRTNQSAGDFQVLQPLQPITASPYAITAGRLTGPISPNSLAGVFGNAVHFTNSGNEFTGAFLGNGAAVTNVNALSVGGLEAEAFWQVRGNANTSPGVDFLGTSDNQPLMVGVNGQPAFRLEPTATSGAVNVLGGSPSNFVAPGAVGATIAGGGTADYLSAPLPNLVGSSYGTIGGGLGNRADSLASTIGGGQENVIEGESERAAIGGGRQNHIQFNADGSIISGGQENSIERNVDRGTVGGGRRNRIQDDADNAIVGGGLDNTVGTNAAWAGITGGRENSIGPDAFLAAIGGGEFNWIQEGAFHATIAGGEANTILSNANAAMIPGGRDNVAGGQYSLAAGCRSQALHHGSFVWADATEADFPSTGDNQFLIRAAGGVAIGTNNPSAQLHVEGDIFAAGTITPSSDRNRKKNIDPVDLQTVLDRLMTLAIPQWSYRHELDEVRHLGPMAQDFHAAFGLGANDTTIATVDADGVALAAIQALSSKLDRLFEEKEMQIQALKAKAQRVEALEERLQILEKALKTTGPGF